MESGLTTYQLSEELDQQEGSRQTLVATDIATGWSESVPILVRDGAVVLTAQQLIRRQLPFPLRGIDADNDPVFMNRDGGLV
ncbi:hypothetical protein SynWH8101_2270 [Synechococcus sp. WH 8101]|uniref:hypothetical protein n=1 Tax=Synechococcus sp. WH 8101 TaxID=59932 RepID=UPI0010246C14|nr:hypothetical protein [Synechococcus sp. WH 8101]QBE69847.1 hypothetical protein SynWH8101_2270 [Synechococcus sp. WH 8101]QNI46106.1 putative transposase for insertion sequence ISRm18 [Synechococcus sp. WH 8101]